MKGGWVGWLVVAVLGVAGCVWWPRVPDSERAIAGAVGEAVDRIGDLHAAGEIAWVGIRDGEGNRTSATELLDEQLVSALLRRGVRLVVADSLAAWGGEGVVPALLWQQNGPGRVMAARVEEDGTWTYLRLFLVERGTGQLLGNSACRLAARHLQAQVALKGRGEGKLEAEAPLEVELHLLGIREEGGIVRAVAIEEQGSLLAGDRMQVRFKVAADCQVYAFLFSSGGVRREVFSSQYVYSGRWQYGPGQEEWVPLEEGDQVHTLYFLAGRRLSEEREELWRRLQELVDQGQVNRFTGLELFDQTLVEFLLREVAAGTTLAVLRGREGIQEGKGERFILQDGTVIESRGEVWRGGPVLVRAVSFAVQ